MDRWGSEITLPGAVDEVDQPDEKKYAQVDSVCGPFGQAESGESAHSDKYGKLGAMHWPTCGLVLAIVELFQALRRTAFDHAYSTPGRRDCGELKTRGGEQFAIFRLGALLAARDH